MLLLNTLTQVKSLLQSLEQAAGGIGLQVNANKMEYICFNWDGCPLKLVDKFKYLSSISSTESDINMHPLKVWIVIDRLSIIWKSDLSDKIKQNFFLAAVVSILLYWCTSWMLTKCIEKKLDVNCTRMLWAILKATYLEITTVQPLTFHL